MIGGTDESGFYKPADLEIVLRWYREPIIVWVESVLGVAEPSVNLSEEIARRILKNFGIGRNMARAEAQDEREESRPRGRKRGEETDVDAAI